MKKLLLILTFIVSFLIGDAQKPAPSLPGIKNNTAGEVMPQFPGGEDAMLKYINANLKYPALARQKRIGGKVFIKYTVDENGFVTDVSVIKGIGGGCDEEAMRVIKAMPRWKPGSKDGEGIRVEYTIPINFQLPKRRTVKEPEQKTKE